MEILAVNESYGFSIYLTAIASLIGVLAFIALLDNVNSKVERLLAGIIVVIVALGITGIWSDPAYVTYDAIVTDWNEVHDNGYKVVETNGEIVTLTKEAD